MIMGVSITASAMTTVISGSMLWLCVLKFFSKFAFLITMTITSSYLWSILFLPVIDLFWTGRRWMFRTRAGEAEREMAEKS